MIDAKRLPFGAAPSLLGESLNPMYANSTFPTEAERARANAMQAAAGMVGFYDPNTRAYRDLPGKLGTFSIYKADNGLIVKRVDGVEAEVYIGEDIEEVTRLIVTALVNDKVGK